MEEVFNNLLVQVGGVAGLVVLVMKLADMVAKLTPTNADNAVLQKVRQFAKIIAADVPDRQ